MKQSGKSSVERLKKFVLERRQQFDWRQQDVAERSGLSLAWVGMLEAGRLKNPPRTETLIKLARGLHLEEETPGALLNFLQLVVAGSLDGRVIAKVAVGGSDPSRAMADATRGKGVTKLGPDEPDLAAAIYHNSIQRSRNLQLVLKLLAGDLPPGDFTLARLLLERLYDEASMPSGRASDESAT